jgi:hypothetical protein
MRRRKKKGSSTAGYGLFRCSAGFRSGLCRLWVDGVEKGLVIIGKP